MTTAVDGLPGAFLFLKAAGSFPLQPLLTQFGEAFQRAALLGFIFRHGKGLFRSDFRTILS